jgi:hypothetical protein
MAIAQSRRAHRRARTDVGGEDSGENQAGSQPPLSHEERACRPHPPTNPQPEKGQCSTVDEEEDQMRVHGRGELGGSPFAFAESPSGAGRDACRSSGRAARRVRGVQGDILTGAA